MERNEIVFMQKHSFLSSPDGHRGIPFQPKTLIVNKMFKQNKKYLYVIPNHCPPLTTGTVVRDLRKRPRNSLRFLTGFLKSSAGNGSG
jgi:hypothetical protein